MDYAQYNTAGRLTLCKNLNNSATSKSKIFYVTHWSVGPGRSNDEKNGGQKSRWTVP